ncbi:ribonuclease R [Mediterraneibacter butyricigenes]|uniref:Ribonuclease R n=1 Tax=Mediterraneibacter butyricigenes TaxID=2316025 RepID=A0A391PLG5_9FIRM|nr:ribonuclease R [Mediterraneibacter butyricigenes]RGO25032.1 ribonuclease R [Dorea sp. OM02-2LB]GCA67822.1 ribonuclease R [Mediterraneibacter butyricigenes]
MDQAFEKRKKVIYDFICDDFYVPMKAKEIAAVLQVSKEDREALRLVLEALVEEGKITLSKRGKYSKGKPRVLTGTFQANARGFGFVLPDAEGEEDLFIPEECKNGAFQGDQVEVLVTGYKEGGRREGKILQILSHGIVHVVGLYQKSKGFGFVLPDDAHVEQDIFVAEADSKGANDGDKVVVELTSYGDGADEKQKKNGRVRRPKRPEGKVVEILGKAGEPGVDILSIIKAYDLPLDFPEKVKNQAERVPDAISEADMAGRLDLRMLQMVTIDGEDAKDLDDAVSLEMDGENYKLGVHIADVANYVQENSALDREALKRGTSVYLVDRVIPMLPTRLSNGICSLNAKEDRLALSCLMTVNPKGEVIDHQIAETVICVNERMTYTSVAKILEEKDPEECQKYETLVPMFEQMAKLSAILRESRKKRGSIDFDFPETKVILDENGKPVELKAYDRNVATKLIEDFMLLANETVAEEYFWREVPFVYRNHEAPDEEKIKSLSTFINNFGFHIHVGNQEVKPKEVQKLLAKIEDTPQEAMICRLALRSMKRAGYTPENLGHFGLAAKYYTHFTSPIRRYPDLQIHRIIKDVLRGRMKEEKAAHYEAILPEVTKHASETERRADEAERETIKLKKTEYMQQHLGEVYEGVISGVTRWGTYVELPNTVEGLVHVSNMMDDHYEYVEDSYEMVGEHTGKTYRLGQPVKIKVLSVDKLSRTIDFTFFEESEE